MKIGGLDLLGNTPSKVVKQGNQYIRKKILVTPSGNLGAALKGDTISIMGVDGKPQVFKMISSDKQLTPQKAAAIFFNNLERLFDRRYDAMPAIKKAFEAGI